MEERCCDYCRDNQNMHFGQVKQVASNEVHGVLLRCLRCGWLSLDPSDGLSAPRPIDSATAVSWFGYST